MGNVSASLVLGAGGARGLAHVGVIRCLEDNGYEIRYISGSSMGALVGGIFAAGKLDAFADWVVALQRLDVLRLLDWSLSGGALFKGERIIRVLEALVGDRVIEELPIGFTAVATELSTGREMWLNRGSLFDAIHASIAVPTIFAPVPRDGLVLVDGGIVNPVPVAPTLNAHTDVTVAVDLNAPDETVVPVRLGSSSEPRVGDGTRQSILRFLDAILPPSDQAPATRMGFYDLAARSMDAMQRTITQLKLASYAPSLVIRIPGNLCGFFDFYRAKELIDFGYERTERALERLGS
ncbi:MAG TPA: patatin-like phospholipase family protein [Gammaproteobacteria bacterium]